MENERMTLSKTDGNKTKEICVEKVENGYITTIDTYGENEKGEYKSECKKYISTTNPLMKKEEQIESPMEAHKSMMDLLDGFN